MAAAAAAAAYGYVDGGGASSGLVVPFHMPGRGAAGDPFAATAAAAAAAVESSLPFPRFGFGLEAEPWSPSSPQHILYATPKDDADDRWQLALGRPTTEYPSAPSWREWLGDHESVDPANPAAVARWLKSHGHPAAPAGSDWLATPVAGPIWEDYLEHRFFIYDSPEAQALHYLTQLKLAHGPLRDPTGDCVGQLEFFAGTMPGGESHFVEAEGEAILPALQHRLRELGENTALRILP